MSNYRVNEDCLDFSCVLVVTENCAQECSNCRLYGCRACSHLDECMEEVENER